MKIVFKHKGDFKKTSKFLNHARNGVDYSILNKYGEIGVDILSKYTPEDTGKTSSSWYYEIEKGKETASLIFHNSNINDGVNIAVVLQYGHGTGTGGYVKGTDYINPALKPIFDDLANEAWEEVTKV